MTAALTVAAGPGEKTAAIGPARARDLAVNVVLPFIHARFTAAATAEPDGGIIPSPALSRYHALGQLQDNEVIRETAARLAAPDKIANTARRQQGLLHLHRRLSGGG